MAVKPQTLISEPLNIRRQLVHSPAAVDMLPAVVSAVGGRIPVLVDGHIRRGTDVIKVAVRA